MDRADVRNNLIDAEPPPFTGRILPPLAPRGPEPPSAVAARSHLAGLRHVGLGVPDLRDAVAFYEGVWGLYRVADDRGVVFLGSVGSAEPYIVRLRQAGQKRVDVVAFAAKSAASVDALYTELATAGVKTVREPPSSTRPAAVTACGSSTSTARLIEVSSDVAPKPFRDLEIGESVPRRLSHVVLNSTDARRTSAWYQKHLGFRLSDWLADRMAFLRVSPEHHCLSFAQRTKVSLNHISFEMRGLDEYLRGTGRLVRHGHPPLWGPGGTAPGTTPSPISPTRTATSSSTPPSWNASSTRTHGSRASGPRHRNGATSGGRPPHRGPLRAGLRHAGGLRPLDPGADLTPGAIT
ncbi:VOC family protein [Actinomadura madurae]|uniref:VOC family protein n=1 Tax=Actinomadura madurae TaxID=1993 RepID=UPI0020D1F966|nr:VOC family protein [Actinomadura madurae]MCP9972300.1 VOC family protein [Actinomadura madurae]